MLWRDYYKLFWLILLFQPTYTLYFLHPSTLQKYTELTKIIKKFFAKDS